MNALNPFSYGNHTMPASPVHICLAGLLLLLLLLVDAMGCDASLINDAGPMAMCSSAFL